MEKTSNALVVALVAAQASVGQVTKEAKNTFHGYKYASSESMIEAAQEALNKHGLAVSAMRWSTSQVPPVKEGEVATSKLSVSYALLHESGQRLEFYTETAVVPEKGRPLDKAEAGALTLNLAYFLRGLLLISRDDETTSVETRNDNKVTAPKAEAPAVDAAPWIAKIKSAADQATLTNIGKEITAAKMSAVPTIREAYMVAYNGFAAK